MELRMYIDVYPGFDPRYAIAVTTPGKTSTGCTRYALVFTIPDPNNPDEIIQVIPKEEEGP